MPSILVVDDNFANRRFLLALLRDKAECDAAASGVEALEAYNLSLREGRPYDALLLDISMPGLGGLDVLHLIRESETNAGIGSGEGVRIIVITGYKEYFKEAFKAGCDDYLLKPVEPAQLYEKIKNLGGKPCDGGHDNG